MYDIRFSYKSYYDCLSGRIVTAPLNFSSEFRITKPLINGLPFLLKLIISLIPNWFLQQSNKRDINLFCPTGFDPVSSQYEQYEAYK